MRNGKNNTEQRHGHRQMDYDYLMDVVGSPSKITHQTLLQNDTHGFAHHVMCNPELQVNTLSQPRPRKTNNGFYLLT